MKRFGVGLLAVMVSFSAYAAKNSQTVLLTQTVQVGSAQLPAGPVKVTWTGTGSDAQLTLVSNGKAPVTVPAQIVDEKHQQAGVSTITVNGAEILQEVQLNNLTFVVRDSSTVAGN